MGLSSTGMLEKVWRRVSSPRPVRILLLLRRTTKRSELTLSRPKERKTTRSIKFDQEQIILSLETFYSFYVSIKHNSKFVASIFVLILFTVIGDRCRDICVSYDNV